MSRREKSRSASRLAAYCGMTAGLSAVLLLAGSALGIATYAVPLLCGWLLLIVLLDFGQRAAWGVWLVVCLLSLVLVPDKEAVLFYAFLGCWPLLRGYFSRIRCRPLRTLAMLAYFLAAFAAIYAILFFLLHLSAALTDFREMGAWLFGGFLLVYLICMLLYDRLLIPMGMLYLQRIRPRIRPRR